MIESTDSKIRVGVLRGGVGHEYNVSLETGSYVLNHIPRDKYRPIDVFVDRDGVWHQNGIPIAPEFIKNYVDVVFNCLHGKDGEDGRIQYFLENLGIPFVGSDSFSSALTGNKSLMKERLKSIGYKTPRYMILKDLAKYSDEKEKSDHLRRKAMEVFKKMSGPWIVKPILGSASTHTYIVTTFSELISILDYLSDLFDEILVEEYIEGKEVVSAILEGYRNEKHYVVPPREIVKPAKILDENIRRKGLHKVYVVGRDSNEHKDKIEEMTKELHREFNMCDFCMVDYIVNPKGIYVIEIDSVPVLAKGEVIHDMMQSIGLSEADFIDLLISKNLNK